MRDFFLNKGILRLQALQLRFTQSLFFVPALIVFGCVLLSQVTVAIDRSIADDFLPGIFQTTVESSRSILAAIAGGTITSASIVFSLTLVAVQLAASQFSPRVLEGFLSDRFQQLVMGTVVGTFSFSLLVLREVSDEIGDESAFVPQLSIAVALVLALASLLAVLASIDHTAKGLRVGTVIDRVMNRTVAVVESVLANNDANGELLLDAPTRVKPAVADVALPAVTDPPSHARLVLAPRTGWVTGLQADQIAEAIPRDSTALIVAAVGTYVVVGTPAIYVWPCTEDQFATLVQKLDEVIRIDDERTLQQDISFGILQLSDVALKALSPGVNDPNTAIEVLQRLGVVVTTLYRHKLGPARTEYEGRVVLRPTEPSLEDYVRQAFEPIRRYARTDHLVLSAMAQTISAIIEDGRRRQDDVGEPALWAQLELMAVEIDLLATQADRIALRQVLDPILAER